MALVVKDRVRETSTSTGTGDIILNGAVQAFQDFSVIGDGNTTYYTIVDATTGAFEVGIGTYTLATTTLSRDTVLESSNAGAAVNFAANVKDVFVTYPAERAVYGDAGNVVSGYTISGGSINNTPIGAITPSTGSFSSLVATTADINGGSIDGTTVGASTPSTVASTNLSYTGTLTGGTGVINIGSGQIYKEASGDVGIGTSSPTASIPLTILSNSGNAIAMNVRGRSDGIGVVLFSDNADAENGRIDFRTNYAEIKQARNAPLILSTNSTERLRITAAGSVGIGTSSPTQPLDVNGNVAITGTGRRITGDFSNATAADRLTFQTSTVNGFTTVPFAPNGTGTGSAVRLNSSSDVSNASIATIIAGGATSSMSLQSGITGTGTYLPMTFFTGGSERLRIDSAGSVGIGTTAPASRFAVVSPTGDPSSISFLGSPDGTTANWRHQLDNSGYSGRLRIRNNAGTETVHLNSGGDSYLTGGNVGIGTSSPAAKLDVVGGMNLSGQLLAGASGSVFSPLVSAGYISGTSNMYLRNISGTNRIDSYNDPITATIPLQLNASQHTFYIADAEKVRITSSGSVGIGTSAPSTAFYVYRTDADAVGTFQGLQTESGGTGKSAIQIDVNGKGGFAIANDATSGTRALTISNNSGYGVSTVEAMRITSSGSVGIGTSAPGAKLTVKLGNIGIDQDEAPQQFFGAGGNVAGTNTTGGVLTVFGHAPNAFGDTSTPPYDGTNFVGAAGLMARGFSESAQYRGSLEFFTKTASDANATSRMLITHDGNVGIGTTSPTMKLDISGTSYGGVYIKSTSTNYSGLLLENTNSATKWQIGVEGGTYHTAGKLNIGIDAVGSAIIIDSSRNVGIGTSSPSSSFQVHRDSATFVTAKISNSVTGSGALDGFDFVCGTSGEAYVYNRENQPIIFGTNNTEKARIDASGNLLVGTTVSEGPSRISSVSTASGTACVRL
jgi:hypothetical protein